MAVWTNSDGLKIKYATEEATVNIDSGHVHEAYLDAEFDVSDTTVGDGVADDTDALQAAITAAGDAGGGVVTLGAGKTYKVTAALTLVNNVALVGPAADKPTIKLVSSTVTRVLNFASDNYVANIIFDGSEAATADYFVAFASASGNTLFNCEFVDFPDNTLEGGIRITGTSSDNIIDSCTFTDGLGSAVGMTGSVVTQNTVKDCVFTDNVGFGVVMGDSSNRAYISGNRTSSNGIELIGIKESCYLNRIENNYAQGCGDNGISITGYDNVCVGNLCYFNDNAGIWVWGSGNVVTGNVCRDNNQIGSQWAGIGVSANFGGTGQHNVICGNVCEDTQAVNTHFNGIRIGGNGYTAWGTGVAVTQSSYRYNGLNLYIATNSGTTGATAPVHTSGVVSDGTVSWRYVRTFTTTVNSVFNQIFGNRTLGGTSAPIVDASTGNGNLILDANLTKLRIETGNLTLGAPSGSVIFVGINNTDQARFDNNVFRPETDNAYALGLTNRRWSNIHATAYSSGASGATVQVVGARRTGWTAATGTATRTTFDTATVTTAQLAERVKALLDDLITHGLIGT